MRQKDLWNSERKLGPNPSRLLRPEPWQNKNVTRVAVFKYQDMGLKPQVTHSPTGGESLPPSPCKKGLEDTGAHPCWHSRAPVFAAPLPPGTVCPKGEPLPSQPAAESRRPQWGWCQSQMGFRSGPTPPSDKATGRQSYAKNLCSLKNSEKTQGQSDFQVSSASVAFTCFCLVLF